MRIKRSETVLASQLDDQTVMMDPESGEYLALNEVASRIWALTESPQTVQCICDQLLEEYEIDPVTCLSQVQQFVKSALDRALFQVIEEDIK